MIMMIIMMIRMMLILVIFSDPCCALKFYPEVEACVKVRYEYDDNDDDVDGQD